MWEELEVQKGKASRHRDTWGVHKGGSQDKGYKAQGHTRTVPRAKADKGSTPLEQAPNDRWAGSADEWMHAQGTKHRHLVYQRMTMKAD